MLGELHPSLDAEQREQNTPPPWFIMCTCECFSYRMDHTNIPDPPSTAGGRLIREERLLSPIFIEGVRLVSSFIKKYFY